MHDFNRCENVLALISICNLMPLLKIERLIDTLIFQTFILIYEKIKNKL